MSRDLFANRQGLSWPSDFAAPAMHRSALPLVQRGLTAEKIITDHDFFPHGKVEISCAAHDSTKLIVDSTPSCMHDLPVFRGLDRPLKLAQPIVLGPITGSSRQSDRCVVDVPASLQGNIRDVGSIINHQVRQDWQAAPWSIAPGTTALVLEGGATIRPVTGVTFSKRQVEALRQQHPDSIILASSSAILLIEPAGTTMPELPAIDLSKIRRR